MTPIERTVKLLNEVLGRKMNSLATYLAEASPYVTAADQPIVEAIQALNATERRHAQDAARLILALEGVPMSGSYDPSVVESNYLSVRYLLGLLISRAEDELVLFGQYRDACELPEARAFLAGVVNDDRAHCDRLRALRQQLLREAAPATLN